MAAVELNSSPLISDANLKYYYRFEANSNATIGGVNGTDTSISYSAAKFGNGAVMNGTSSNILLNTTLANYERTQAMSFYWWSLFTGTSARAVFTSLTAASPFNGINLQFNSSTVAAHSGELCFELISTYSTNHLSVFSSTGGATLNDGNFHQVCVTYDGSSAASGVKIYVDGVSVSLGSAEKNSLSASILSSNNRYFGVNTAGGLSNFYNGTLDDTAIFDRVLTAQEISDLYNGSTAFPRKSLLGVGR